MYLFIIMQLFLTPVWETHGPYGEETICIAIDPSDTLCMYAGTGNVEGMVGYGVYRSEDGGRTWEHTSLNYGHIWDIEVDSRRNVYAATVGYGILKTMDGGDTWLPINNGLSCQVVSDIVFHPDNDSIIYACTGDKFAGTLFGLPADGLYKSDDEGNSWYQVGFDDMAVSALAISPSSPDTMYLAVRDAYYVDPSPTDTLSVAYKSTDGGETWTPLSSLCPGYGYFPCDVKVNPLNADVVFVGTDITYNSVWKSADGGETWTGCIPWDFYTASAVVIKVDPVDTNVVYVGGGGYPTMSIRSGTIYKSTNGGETFYICDTLPCNPFHGIAINPQNHNTVYAACSGPGIYKSIDQGQTWEWYSDGMTLTTVFSIDIDPVNGRIFAASNVKDWNDYSSGAGIYRSDDYGKSWKNISWGLTQLRTSVVRVAPSAPDTVYLQAFGACGCGEYSRSFDGGDLWEVIPVGGRKACSPTKSSSSGLGMQWLCVNPLNAAEFYTLVGMGWGLYKSTDAGSTSTLIDSNPDTVWGGALTMHPHDTSIVYIGGMRSGTGMAHVWKTPDGGETWEDVGSDIDSGIVWGLSIDPFDPAIVYTVIADSLFALEGEGRLFKYDGSSWAETGEGLPDIPFSCIEIDPVTQDVLYLGTRGEGVYRSLDGGATWEELNEGIGNLSVNCIMLDPLDHTTIYAGTNAGVYSITSPPGIEEENTISLSLLTVSPNPFTIETVIGYQLPVISVPTALSIYDIIGRLIKCFTIDDSRLTNVAWDGKDNSGNLLPPGVYFVRLESGKTEYKAKKIVKLK
ncbi:T9SS type A sorting domain-containing protein [candidate division WOR-3 bacterium]|nr:T9SS type A sorting domain-containing protein [candidate division WOR-3 bacterium]